MYWKHLININRVLSVNAYTCIVASFQMPNLVSRRQFCLFHLFSRCNGNSCTRTLDHGLNQPVCVLGCAKWLGLCEVAYALCCLVHLNMHTLHYGKLLSDAVWCPLCCPVPAKSGHAQLHVPIPYQQQV